MHTSKLSRTLESSIRAEVAKNKRRGVWITVCGSAALEDIRPTMCVIVEAWGKAGIDHPPEAWKAARAKRCFDRLVKSLGESRVRLSFGRGQYAKTGWGLGWKKVG